MKHIISVLIAALFFLASPAWATAYFITTSGVDTNTGLSTGLAWASPNHAVNCGDTITVSSGTYSSGQFGFSKWGTVSGCSTGSSANVATVICATAFACNVTATSAPGVGVTASFWRVSGFTATVTGGQAICFEAYPYGGSQIHHIVFDNDIANGCYGAGFQPVPNGSVGVDYFAVIGSIAYNATKQTTQCGSGISIFEPQQSDTLAGTHIYISQTFTWANINGGVSGTNCGGTTPTDGEGVIFDTFDGIGPYTQQGVMENNLALYNGNSSFRVDLSTHANIFILNNTGYAGEQDSGIVSTENGEIFIEESNGVTISKNIVQPTVATLGSYPVYTYGASFYSATPNGTDVVSNNQGYSSAGNNTGCVGSCSAGTPFTFGTGNTTTNPGFASPPSSVPAAPSCGAFATVPACMATIIADFVPSSPSNAAWGYHAPVTTYTADSYFPTWLCNVGLASGIVSTPCGSPPTTAGSTLIGATLRGGKIQ